ncbi:MAG: trypsin-like peptidase domain-containing protein [Planctomycetota bacterium]
MWNALLALPLLSTISAAQNPAQDALYAELQQVSRVTPEVLVVQAVTPTVVHIETEITQRVRSIFGTTEQMLSGSGSGVVIHSEGYIVTNYHVVKGAQSILVSFDGDPDRYPAELVSFVRSEDLALLKVEPRRQRPGSQRAGGFPTVRMGTSAGLYPGERVIAIGNPYGQSHTVSTGIISGLHRDVPIPDQGLHFGDLIQTDASINLGNSGGPLLNIRGELIGINTVMNRQAENIGFAIPVDRVREVLTDLLFPQARSSWLGFDLAPGEPLQVAHVWADGPADTAGICEGDLLLELAGKRISSQDDFLHASLEVQPGREIPLSLAKAGGGSRQVTLDTWDRVDGLLFERLGLTVRTRKIGRQTWIFVDRLRPDGPAQEIGLRIGDLIPAIQPQLGRRRPPLRIRDRETLARVVAGLEPGVLIDLDVYRDENGDHAYASNERYEGSLTLH